MMTSDAFRLLVMMVLNYSSLLLYGVHKIEVFDLKLPPCNWTQQPIRRLLQMSRKINYASIILMKLNFQNNSKDLGKKKNISKNAFLQSTILRDF